MIVGYLQFAPMVLALFRDIEDILFSTYVAVASDEGVLVDWVPVDKQIDYWAVISGDHCCKFLEEADCHSVVREPSK